MKNDLYYIKKKYGENMAHLCRKLFPTILEENGKLFSILKDHFDYNKNLYNDIIDNKIIAEFYHYIMSFFYIKDNIKIEVNETPFELMNKANYNLYKCETYNDILKFKKYYKKDEELCTFRDKDRVNNYDVFFAVKKNAKKIKRKDFDNPEREDEYGTSVISIQFSKEFNQLSIKNRYNHTVINPDATYSNNLNNIIYGLQESFNKYYNYNISEPSFYISDYVKVNEKFYHYNLESDNIYYCSNNIIIDNGRVIKYDPSRYVLFDVFILDIKEKKIFKYTNKFKEDTFLSTIPEIESVRILKNKTGKKIIINKEIEIDLDIYSNFIGYKNNNIKIVEDNFLIKNKALKSITLENVQIIGDNFLKNNSDITNVNIPNLEEVKSNFLQSAKYLNSLSLPKLKKVGNGFLYFNLLLETVGFPSLISAGDDFLRQNTRIKSAYFPILENVGDDFMLGNEELEMIVFPKLENVGDDFISSNNKIKVCLMPNLKYAPDEFISKCDKCNFVYIPKLRKDNNFMDMHENKEEVKILKY